MNFLSYLCFEVQVLVVLLTHETLQCWDLWGLQIPASLPLPVCNPVWFSIFLLLGLSFSIEALYFNSLCQMPWDECHERHCSVAGRLTVIGWIRNNEFGKGIFIFCKHFVTSETLFRLTSQQLPKPDVARFAGQIINQNYSWSWHWSNHKFPQTAQLRKDFPVH